VKRVRASTSAPELITTDEDGNCMPSEINEDDNAEDTPTKPTRVKPLTHLTSVQQGGVIFHSTRSTTDGSPHKRLGGKACQMVKENRHQIKRPKAKVAVVEAVGIGTPILSTSIPDVSKMAPRSFASEGRAEPSQRSQRLSPTAVVAQPVHVHIHLSPTPSPSKRVRSVGQDMDSYRPLVRARPVSRALLSSEGPAEVVSSSNSNVMFLPTGANVPSEKVGSAHPLPRISKSPTPPSRVPFPSVPSFDPVISSISLLSPNSQIPVASISSVFTTEPAHHNLSPKNPASTLPETTFLPPPSPLLHPPSPLPRPPSPVLPCTSPDRLHETTVGTDIQGSETSKHNILKTSASPVPIHAPNALSTTEVRFLLSFLPSTEREAFLKHHPMPDSSQDMSSVAGTHNQLSLSFEKSLQGKSTREQPGMDVSSTQFEEHIVKESVSCDGGQLPVGGQVASKNIDWAAKRNESQERFAKKMELLKMQREKENHEFRRKKAEKEKRKLAKRATKEGRRGAEVQHQ
jgi:hypothetical protein